MSSIPKFPNGKEYEMLYRRYFENGTDYIANIMTGCKTVIDLCGGTGRLTENLKRKGVSVVYHDGNSDMCLLDNSYDKIFCSIDSLLDYNFHFDGAVCMQAINYWFNDVDVSKLANLCDLFVFNTFVNKPEEKGYKSYSINGNDFIEFWVTNNNRVKHHQVLYSKDSKATGGHITEFDYIPLEVFEERLSQYFDVEIVKNEKSAIFVCKRRF